MGQTIEIRDADVVGDIMMVSTDRSLTGQDGESYVAGTPIGPDPTFPAHLAVRLFESDADIDHIYVMSNVLSIRRRGGWDDSSSAEASSVVSSFFNFYRDSQPGVPEGPSELDAAADGPPVEAPPAADGGDPVDPPPADDGAPVDPPPDQPTPA